MCLGQDLILQKKYLILFLFPTFTYKIKKDQCNFIIIFQEIYIQIYKCFYYSKNNVNKIILNWLIKHIIPFLIALINIKWQENIHEILLSSITLSFTRPPSCHVLPHCPQIRTSYLMRGIHVRKEDGGWVGL